MTVKLYQIEMPPTSQTSWCNGGDLLPAVWAIKHQYYEGKDDYGAMDSFVGKLVVSAVREVMRQTFYEIDAIPSVRELRFLPTADECGNWVFITICYNQKRGHLSTWGGRGGDDARIHWSCYMD